MAAWGTTNRYTCFRESFMKSSKLREDEKVNHSQKLMSGSCTRKTKMALKLTILCFCAIPHVGVRRLLTTQPILGRNRSHFWISISDGWMVNSTKTPVCDEIPNLRNVNKKAHPVLYFIASRSVVWQVSYSDRFEKGKFLSWLLYSSSGTSRELGGAIKRRRFRFSATGSTKSRNRGSPALSNSTPAMVFCLPFVARL